MEIDIITRQDLQQLRMQLREDMKELFGSAAPPKSEWLRSSEVRKLLKISPGTLQNLRVTGVLRYTKVGNMLYYKYEDIVKMLEQNKSK
jgi:hypothetical protein